MNLYYSSPSEQKYPALTVQRVIDCAGRVSGQVAAHFTRVYYKGMSDFPYRGPVGVAMHNEVKESALDKVSQKGFLMAVQESNPDTLVMNLEKIARDADIQGLPAPFLGRSWSPSLFP